MESPQDLFNPPQKPPMYKFVIYNHKEGSTINYMVLRCIFKFSSAEAHCTALAIQTQNYTIVGRYTADVAETYLGSVTQFLAERGCWADEMVGIEREDVNQ